MVLADLSFGAHYVVEFDTDSLWYETSVTAAAGVTLGLACHRGHWNSSVVGSRIDTMTSVNVRLARLDFRTQLRKLPTRFVIREKIRPLRFDCLWFSIIVRP